MARYLDIFAHRIIWFLNRIYSSLDQFQDIQPYMQAAQSFTRKTWLDRVPNVKVVALQV